MQTSDKDKDIHSIPELNYITQIIFLLFEDLSQPEKSDLRYSIRIHFSPGVRCRDELTVPGEIHSPDLSVKHTPAQFIKRLPVVAMDSHLLRRHSDSPAKHEDSGDSSGKHKELVVRRMSEKNGNQYDVRFKSFSETEMLAMRRKCTGFLSMPVDVSRSKSMDALTMGSCSPKQLSHSLSQRKPLLDSPALQVQRGVAAMRKVTCPGMLPETKDVASHRTANPPGYSKSTQDGIIAPDFLQSKGSVTTIKSAPELGGVLSSNVPGVAFSQPQIGTAFPRKCPPNVPELLPRLATFQIEEGDEDDVSSCGNSTPVDGDSRECLECDRKSSDGQPTECKGAGETSSSDAKCQSTCEALAKQPQTGPGHTSHPPSRDLHRVKGGVASKGKASGNADYSNLKEDSGSRRKAERKSQGRDSDEMSSDKSAPLNNQGSNEQLNRHSDSGVTVAWPSALGERGQCTLFKG